MLLALPSVVARFVTDPRHTPLVAWLGGQLACDVLGMLAGVLAAKLAPMLAARRPPVLTAPRHRHSCKRRSQPPPNVAVWGPPVLARSPAATPNLLCARGAPGLRLVSPGLIASGT